MPLYEYRCKNCGASFEVFQKVNETQLKKCINCGGELEKVISPPALQFKGKGWYVTDYAQKNTSEKEEKPATQKEKSEKPSPSKGKKGKASSPSK
jgi:putative FmdB family regulatory protein